MNNTEYPKVEKELFNVENENLQKLASLFPSAVKDGQLDIEALKEELGQFEEVGQEKYELNWAGKQNAKKEARKNVLGKTLRYIEGDGVNEDTTQNLYIEGDNLEVLKLLRKNYYGSIKMIYIDPPYNTGNDFVYNDNFSMSQEELEQMQGERDEYGERLQKNSKDSAKYHTNWLNMMYPRLQLAKDLLTDDGVIFISIDDNEQTNLKQLCDCVFGEENFVANFPRITKRGGKSTDTYAKNHDYVIVYAKNTAMVHITGIAHFDEGFKYEDEYVETRGKYKLNQTLDYNTLGYINSLDYPIEINGQLYYPGNATEQEYNERKRTNPKDGFRWRWSQDLFEFGYKNDWIVVSQSGRIYTKTYLNATINKKSNGEYYIEYKERTKPISTLDFVENEYSNDNSNKEISNLMGTKLFDYVKPTSLIYQFLLTCTDKNSIILDFFSGSATTAQAVMRLNSENNEHRKFILVQLPEITDDNSEAKKAGFDNICEIGKERNRKAGQKIKEEIEQGNQQLNLGEEQKQLPDIGFKVFRVGETTLNWEKLRLQGKDMYHDYIAGTSEKDKLDFTPDFQNDLNVVYEIMLRQEGLPLTSTIEKLTDIGTRTYLVADSYLISLEENVTPEMIEKLSTLNPLPIKFVFRDSAFDDDIVLKDETFRKLNALIDKNTSDEKKTYTVEFI